jgi:riboflavin biosynthesis pyrimidine reductase
MKKSMSPELSQEKNTDFSYLDQNLQELAQKIGRAVVIANYVCDLHEVIAKRDELGQFQVAGDVKNADDWRHFQELNAQANAIFTGGEYLKRVARLGKEKAENVLSQFNPEGKFADLGDWRQSHRLARNPDILIISRSLDFELPEGITVNGRKVYIFTTYEMAGINALKYQRDGVTLVGAGLDGVEGKVMFDYLKKETNYRVIKNTTGPRVLDILLGSGTLDRLYITQVGLKINYTNPENVQRIFNNGKCLADLTNFKLTQDLVQNNVTTATGINTSQHFLIYDNQRFLADIKRIKK